MNLLALVTRILRVEKLFTSQTKVYPSEAAGVTVTAAAGGGFAKGTYAQVVPVATITTVHRVTAIVVDNPSAADEYEIDIATGLAASEVVVGTIKVTGAGRYQFNCANIDANTRIAARIGCLDAVARTAGITFEYSDDLL